MDALSRSIGKRHSADAELCIVIDQSWRGRDLRYINGKHSNHPISQHTMNSSPRDTTPKELTQYSCKSPNSGTSYIANGPLQKSINCPRPDHLSEPCSFRSFSHQRANFGIRSKDGRTLHYVRGASPQFRLPYVRGTLEFTRDSTFDAREPSNR